MTDATELVFKNISHEKMFCGFLFDIENIRMTVGTIQPFHMYIMWEIRRRNIGPFSLKFKPLPEIHRLFFRIEDAVKWGDSATSDSR